MGLEVGPGLGGDRLHFGVGVADFLQVAVGNMAERVARGADFLVDLEATLHLLAIELAEHAVAGKREVLGMLVELGFDRVGQAFMRSVHHFPQERPGQRQREAYANEDGDNADHGSVSFRLARFQAAAAGSLAASSVPSTASVIEKEREIAAQSEAVKNKPPQAVAKIIEGKIGKFLETACLLEQGFVKNPDLKVEAHLAAVAKTLGDTIQVRRFLRYQVGEA